ncbi:hypothetical protein EVJ58_g7486 [Rhodofomes roseus]|uniref:Uncharacterized protein n=1 Tax=Rhodofomes roseus TaxID=34475 RepID=A0A4Y9Y5I4_9APHY|nr:hypothetical protein EVJ58_g7486 [Rhodofomes roseus]
MVRFGNINPCVDQKYTLAEYALAGETFDTLPPVAKELISANVKVDPKFADDPRRVVAQRVVIQRRLLNDLLNLDASIRAQRQKAPTQPFRMGSSFLRWWQGALHQKTIRTIMEDDLRMRHQLVHSFVESFDALVWLETCIAGSPGEGLAMIQAYRDKLLRPIIKAVNRSLTYLGEYILAPLEDAAKDGIEVLWDSLEPDGPAPTYGSC